MPTVFYLYAVCSVCLLCAVCSGYWVCAVCACCALCAVFGSFVASQCHAVPRLFFCLHFTQKLFPRTRIRHTPLSLSSLFLHPGANCTVPLAILVSHVYGNPNLSVLGSILYFLCSVSCVPALCPVFSLNKCCLFCALAVCRYYLGIIGCVLGVFAVRYVLCVSCYAPQ